jgi:hypothetical protein
MNAPSIDHARTAPSRDPVITQALGAALKALGSADNDNAKLLAVRNFAEAVAPFGRAADEAVLVLRTAATVRHGIALETVQALFEQGLDIAQMRRSRPPPLPEGVPTAPSTVEAIMFMLRRGRLDARLASCDDAAIREIAGRLTGLGWPDEDIKPVILAWRAARGARS